MSASRYRQQVLLRRYSAPGAGLAARAGACPRADGELESGGLQSSGMSHWMSEARRASPGQLAQIASSTPRARSNEGPGIREIDAARIQFGMSAAQARDRCTARPRPNRTCRAFEPQGAPATEDLHRRRDLQGPVMASLQALQDRWSRRGMTDDEQQADEVMDKTVPKGKDEGKAEGRPCPWRRKPRLDQRRCRILPYRIPRSLRPIP